MAQNVGYTKEPLEFKVTRQPPELIIPSKPTPYELKELSDIDSQDSVRFQLPVIVFYRGNSAMMGKDPSKVIKDALAKALVPYYPLAGRMKENEQGKLVVECTGEGIMFIEGDADVTLEVFGDPIHPPIPCLEELIFDVPGTSDMFNTPLILMQVTRLKCGGFIMAFRMSHPMADAQGIALFLKAIVEMSHNAYMPSIQPVWERHLLSARNPPRVTCEHHVYNDLPHIKSPILISDYMIQRKSFYFGPVEIAALKRLVPPHLKSSTFDNISAYLWRSYTISLQPDPEDVVRTMFVVNARNVFNPPLPSGYYGNVITFQVAVSTVANLCNNSLGYAVELLKKAKAEVTHEYMRSLADLLALKRLQINFDYRTFTLSDITRGQSVDLDFGWGSPKYLGTAKSGVVETEMVAVPGGNYISFQDSKNGETGIVVSLCLPKSVMEAFVQVFNMSLRNGFEHRTQTRSPNRITSSL